MKATHGTHLVSHLKSTKESVKLLDTIHVYLKNLYQPCLHLFPCYCPRQYIILKYMFYFSKLPLNHMRIKYFNNNV